MVDRNYTIADIAAKTGIGERLATTWADALVLHAEPQSNRAGRGVHRKFHWREVEIASVLAKAAPFRMTTGVLVRLAVVLRNLITLGAPPRYSEPEGEIAEAARRGEPIEMIVFSDPDEASGFGVGIRWASRPDASFRIERHQVMLVINLGACWEGLQT
jgi:hypothetical protein